MILRDITKTLYVPVEIIDRELGGAILLAAHGALRGWTIVIGGKQALFNNISRFRASPGIFLLKSIVPGEVFKQDELIASGHRVVSLDVEGLVPSNGEAGVRLRYSADSIKRSDLVFFWGEEHYAAVRHLYPEVIERSCVSGSPLIDEIKVRGARHILGGVEKKRKKILIGTSCGLANHINGIDFSKEMRRNAYADNVGHDEILALELEAELDIEIFEYWKNIVPKIAQQFQDCDVVLRPHPSENVDVWRSCIKSLKNVRIDAGQPILEELLDASVYIHFNSTSAITSLILGIPTLMPMPTLKQSLRERITYVSGISELGKTTDELIQLIGLALTQNIAKNPPEALFRHCENLKSGSLPAAEKIIDKLEKTYQFGSNNFNLQRQNTFEVLIVLLRKTRHFLLWILALFFRISGIKLGRSLPPLNAYKNATAKQPKTSLVRLHSLMENLIETDIFQRLKVESIATNLFIIRCGVVQNDSKD